MKKALFVLLILITSAIFANQTCEENNYHIDANVIHTMSLSQQIDHMRSEIKKCNRIVKRLHRSSSMHTSDTYKKKEQNLINYKKTTKTLLDHFSLINWLHESL